ncbi:MAG: hypothetical protein ABI729_01735, partial [Chitinophagales bacterium]
DNKAGLFCGQDFLLMRRYFIPILEGENSNYIFLTHACATSCSALLTLSKRGIPADRDFSYVIDYDIANGQIVYIPERSYSLDTLEVSIADLRRQKEKSIIFKNICNLIPEEGCIDSINFDKSQVKLFSTLIDRSDSTGTKHVSEIYTVKFNK